MISNSDTVQTLTLGLAFMALFVGATVSLPTTAGNALYNTTNAATADSTDNVERTALASADQGAELSQSTLFSNTALASGPKPLTEMTPELTTDIDGKTPREVHELAQDRARMTDGDTPVMTQTDKREILWLARIMYSETKRADEQELIGWVVRNRVDTGYTGYTYEDVAKRSAQFSGLNPGDNLYEHNISRWYSSGGHSWEKALELAKKVYFADESERPLALTTRHFYSPHAVNRTPAWAQNQQAVRLIKDPQTNRVRFALYDKVR